MRKIIYSFLVLDLMHWGHIVHLKQAQNLGDLLIVGILDDDTVESYKRRPVIPLEDRMKMASIIKGVDLVIPQFEQFPLENLKILHRLFPEDKLICVHGKDWNKQHFSKIENYLKSIDGELHLLNYFPKIGSTTNILRDIIERFRKKEKGTK